MHLCSFCVESTDNLIKVFSVPWKTNLLLLCFFFSLSLLRSSVSNIIVFVLLFLLRFSVSNVRLIVFVLFLIIRFSTNFCARDVLKTGPPILFIFSKIIANGYISKHCKKFEIALLVPIYGRFCIFMTNLLQNRSEM